MVMETRALTEVTRSEPRLLERFWDGVSNFDTALGKFFLLPIMLMVGLGFCMQLGFSSTIARHFVWSILTIIGTTAISIYSIAMLPVLWLAAHPNSLVAFALAQVISVALIVKTIVSFAQRRMTVLVRTYGVVPVCVLPMYTWRGSPVSWKRIKKVQMSKDGHFHLQFSLQNGQLLSMPLLPSLAERHRLLSLIRERAPWAKIESGVIQQMAPNRCHSYTEIWLDSLCQSSVRRCSTQLPDGTILKDGEYSIIRQIGAGGQGVAYLANARNPFAFESANKSRKSSTSQTKLLAGGGKKVVLKEFMLPACTSLRTRDEAMERLHNEALLLVDLTHPQMVKLTDFFIEDHRAYLVIDHVEGTSLRELVSELGPLPEFQVRELALQMCKILDYLHSQSPQIVHRDFTPENLILEHTGTLKLIDFNVAQQSDCTDSPLIVGKPSYMPPEQVKGRAVAQSDIYALGATLYFLLTGVDPEPISQSQPKSICSTVGLEMDRIVSKCTAMNLCDRYSSIRSVQVDLCSLYPNTSPSQKVFIERRKK